ncbi:hypothetical protein EYB53_024825, partial [Candidatus Chloroploca sp. M-50]
MSSDPTMPPPEASPPPPTRRALVIGVNGSARDSMQAPLARAEDDARRLAATLESPACGFAVQLVTGADAEAPTLIRALQDLLYEAAATSELFVFFSGHAVPVARGPRDQETFLVTSDFDPQRAAKQPERYLTLGWLYEQLYRHKEARSVMLFLDCCFAGDIVGQGDQRLQVDFGEVIAQFREGLAAQTMARYRDKLRVLLPVVGPGQQAHEGATGSVATALFIDLLSGTVPHAQLDDGRVTVDLVIDRLRKALPHLLTPLTSGQGLWILADHQAAITAARAAGTTDTAQQRAQRLRSLLHDHSGFLANRMEAFVGREQELADLRSRIAALLPSGGYVTITGQAGQGKSSLIARLIIDALAFTDPAARTDSAAVHAKLHAPDRNVPIGHFIPFHPGPDHQVGLLRNLLARLCLSYDLPTFYATAESRPALRDYLATALREIAAQGHEAIIYLDGLDQLEEDLSGVRDLSFLPEEPPVGIVFVVGTRPNDTLQPLALRKPQHTYAVPPLSRRDFDLILAHRGVRLDTSLADRFYTAMEANALYLDLGAKELREDHALPPEALIARLAADPNAIFSISLARLKRHRQQWREVLKPILGFLLASRAPLSQRALRALVGVDDDTIREGLARLGGLLQRDGEGRFSLFHLKFGDFLRQHDAEPAQAYIFARDEAEAYHQLLADWCTGGRGGLATIWDAAPGDALEQERRAYARQHVIAHLAAARSYAALWAVIDAGTYSQAKRRHDPSMRSYVLDLDLARQAVLDEAGDDHNRQVHALPRLFRYSLLRGTLTSQVDRYPKPLFMVLVALGRTGEAINLVEVISDPATKIMSLFLIAITAVAQGALEEAQTIWERIWSSLSVVADATIRTQMLVELAEISLLTSQQWENQGPVEDDFFLDKLMQADVLAEASGLLARAKPWEVARSTAEDIAKAVVRGEQLTKLAESLATAEHPAAEAIFTAARAIIDEIPEADERAQALVALGRTFATAKHPAAEATFLAARTV